MFDPFKMWSEMMRAGRMVGETMVAANDVVASRGETIAAAARDPLGADTNELSRMVTEKGSAFSRAGSSLAGDWMTMQGDMMRQAQAIGAVCLSGRMPSPAAATAIANRGARLSQSALTSGIKALRPIHAMATANRRRLSKNARP